MEVKGLSDVTIYTLAKELGMTPSMVSRAFNPDAKISDEKRKTVLEAAKKYDFSPNKLASRLSMKNVKIGILINNRFEVNTNKMLRGIENAYEKLKDYKIKYDICLMDPYENSIDDYQKALSRYRDYDGVILSCMSSPEYTDIINGLYEYNKNIAQVQSVNNEVNHLFESKHNEETASGLAAEFLYNCLRKNERKNLLLFTGDGKSALHRMAGLYFKNSCDRLGMNVIESVDMKDDEEYFEKIIPGIMEKYAGHTDGIYITSGFSGPLCKYLEKTGLDIPFVAFDTYTGIKAYMKKGIISASIEQNVLFQMQTAFELLAEYLISGKKPPETVYTDIQVVLKSNMHQFE